MLTCYYTTGDVLGPYYRENAPLRNDLTGFGGSHEKLIINGKVTVENCDEPLANAKVEVWLADDDGIYDNNSPENRNRGTWYTDNEGRYKYTVRLPGKYLLDQKFRPAHIHFRITKGEISELVTQIYFIGDPDIEGDPFASLPYSRDRILPITRTADNELVVEFNINTKKHMESTFTGSWLYRSFHNYDQKVFDGTLDDLQQNLLWFEAVMTITEDANGKVIGLLDGGTPDYKYDLIGQASKFKDVQASEFKRILNMEAHGATDKTKGDVYKYCGVLSKEWPDGVDQLASFTGTIIRAKRPENPTLEGTVGCFICVVYSTN